MHFLFGSITTPSKQDYVEKKITATARALENKEQPFTPEFIQQQVLALENIDMADAIALANKADFYSLDTEQERLVDISKYCALKNLVHTSPLIEGEHIVEDFFSYLVEPLEEFEVGTAVLLRKTNMAEIYYVFEGVTISVQGIEYAEVEQVPEAAIILQAAGSIDDKIKEIISGLLSKAAGAAGETLGVFIMNIILKQLFGHEDNKELIERIQGVVKEELQSNEIDKINATIKGTVQYMTNEYRLRKESSDLTNIEERKELLQSLSMYSHDFYSGVIGLLENYGEKGLVSYQLAIAIHLLITQEQALVDWKSMGNPSASSFASTVKANARAYKEHIRTVYDTMVTRRMGEINAKHDPDYACGRIKCSVTRDAWSWGDSRTHEGKKYYSDQDKNGRTAKEKAMAAVNNQKSKALRELKAQTANPEENSLPYLENLAKNGMPV